MPKQVVSYIDLFTSYLYMIWLWKGTLKSKKTTRVHKNSASLIDNVFVNNPEQVLISGNLITDVSDHFSQFCILTSTRDKIKRKQNENRDLSHFNPDSLTSNLAPIDRSCIYSLKYTQIM